MDKVTQRGASRAGLETYMGEIRYSYKILVGNLKERDHLEGLSTDGTFVSKWVLNTLDGKTWTGSI
jgi:hypothetical protein